jgi:hypothetical protein
LPYFSWSISNQATAYSVSFLRLAFVSLMPSSIFFMRLVGLEAVVGGDALDADFGEARDVLLGHVAAELFQERLQAAADPRQHAFPGLRFLDEAVDTLLDEDALERVPVPLLLEFAELDLEFALEEFLGGLGAALRMSRTPRKTGRSLPVLGSRTITQAAGESCTWQLVKT